jgi:hypothetical protein
LSREFKEADVSRDIVGRFDEKRQSAPEVSLGSAIDLRQLHPANVDHELAEIYGEAETAGRSLGYLRGEVDRQDKTIRAIVERGERYEGQLRYQQTLLEEKLAKLDAVEQQVANIQAKAVPYELEFARRGGWSRAFLAKSSTNPHVHRSMSCSTCNKRDRPTMFAWMTDFSGMDEERIVQAAGERACTTCYPSAPVDVLGRPTTMFSDEEVDAARQREERAALKAQREADREAKAISSPHGTSLRHGYHEARTLVTAERELIGALTDIVAAENGNGNNADESRVWAGKLVQAIAAKKGVDEAEVRATAQRKAEAKFRREYR